MPPRHKLHPVCDHGLENCFDCSNDAICAECGGSPCEGVDDAENPFCSEGCAREYHNVDE